MLRKSGATDRPAALAVLATEAAMPLAHVLLLPSLFLAVGPDELIARLDAPSWRDRRDAQAALIDLGPAARPAIEDALAAGPSPEAQSRLRQALGSIGNAAAAGPTRVTLAADARPMADVIADLTATADAQIDCEPAELLDTIYVPPVTADWENAPLWQVMRDLADHANLFLRAESGRWVLSRREQLAQGLGPAAVSGPALAEVAAVRRDRVVRFAEGLNGRADVDFHVEVKIFLEAKLRPAAGSLSAELVRAIDDRGHDLAADAEVPRVHDHTGPGWTTRLRLAHPSDLGREIAVVEAEASCDVLADFHAVDVTADAGFTADIEGVGVTIRPVARDEDGRWQLAVEAAQDGETALFAADDLLDGIELRTAAGRLLRVREREQSHVTRGGVTRTTGTFTFHPGGEPGRVVWQVPTRRLPVVIPIRFENVPIP